MVKLKTQDEHNHLRGRKMLHSEHCSEYFCASFASPHRLLLLRNMMKIGLRAPVRKNRDRVEYGNKERTKITYIFFA
jgi:hypothetical protein